MRFALVISCFAVAALGQRKPITLDALNEWRDAASSRMRQSPGDPVWAPDGKRFAFRQSNVLKLYDVPSTTARDVVSLSVLDTAAAEPPSPKRMQWENRRVDEASVQWFPSGDRLLVVAGGDLFAVEANGGKWIQLTKTAKAERDPKLSPDGSHVAFVRDWDIFALDLANGKETPLTKGGSETIRNGVPDWVYPEELNLGTAYWWAPDSKAVAYLQFDISREPLYPHADLRGERAIAEPQHYPQAGENNAQVRLGVVSSSGGKTNWLDVGETVRSRLIARVGWTPDATRVWVVRTNRIQNQLDFLLFDPASGKSSVAYRDQDPYWINIEGDPVFLPDSSGFLWTSERDGHSHLFRYGVRGEKPIQLTHGDWEVTGIACVDAANTRVYFVSSQPTPLDRELGRVGFLGGGPASGNPLKKTVTAGGGTHRVSMSPGCAYYLDTYSALGTPPETTLHSADGAKLAVFRPASREATDEYELLPSEILSFRGSEGTLLYGRLTKPAGFDASRKYPLIVNVYGGPHAQDVRNSWAGMSLDQVFAHEGYVVWQMDNRGTHGRGHAFETPVFHRLGDIELADQRAGIDYLLSRGFVDRTRIGVRGWSYGGFMTVNMMLRAPDLVRAGFAGAPVTNWLNYDTIYTERYMGLPEDNAEAYRATGMSQHAARLQGRLMIAHNIEDDNVLFQNSLQLIDALETAGKEFDFMLYPQKTHAVGGLAARQMERTEIDFFHRHLNPDAR